jgi:uncharacterized phage protein (TIGR02220 family)
MAERRMFAKTIIRSDAFLEMPSSSQCLYFQLNAEADDEGFVNNPKSVMKVTNCCEDDIRILIAKKFILPFESGVIVIKHWKIHNYIRGDRIHETKYKNERETLAIDENGSYTRQLPDTCLTIDGQLTDSCHTEDRLGKDRLGKDRLGKVNTMSGDPTAQTINEAIKEVVQFLNEKTGCHYKPSSQATIKLIKARLNDDFTLQDFKTVISKKCAEWKNTEQEKFLRPETLFGTKFEGYLNQKIVKKSSNPFLAMLEDEDEQEGGGGSTGLPCDNIPKRIQG